MSASGFRSLLLRRPGYLLIACVLLALTVVGLLIASQQLWAHWHERKGQQQEARFDFQAAYEHYQKSLQIWSGSGALHLAAARAARRSHNFEAAEEHLRLSQKFKGTSAA